MTVYAVYWWEWGEQDTLDDIFPTEESARHTANQILVQKNIEGVSVIKCQVSEYGLRSICEVYKQEKNNESK